MPASVSRFGVAGIAAVSEYAFFDGNHRDTDFTSLLG